MKSQIINLTHSDAPFFPPQGNGIRYLHSTEEFMNAFEHAWKNTKRYFFKYEDRQTYQEAGDESLEHYLAGRKQAAIATLRDGLEYEENNFRDLQSRGANYLRIRPVVEPLSNYLQWEVMSYQISSSIGQEIRLFDDGLIAQARREFCVSDFMIFDDHHTILQNYNDDGLLVGGWVVTEHTHIQRYKMLFDRMVDVTIPLSEFLTSHPELRISDAT